MGHAISSTPTSPCLLEIRPLGVTLPVSEGQSLLEAALAAGVVMRSACRNGTCRECIARVLQGRVRHRIDWPGLSAEERAEGWVLPCVALADSDVSLLQPLAALKTWGGHPTPPL